MDALFEIHGPKEGEYTGCMRAKWCGVGVGVGVMYEALPDDALTWMLFFKIYVDNE
jgi:hypothetical protein